MKSEDIATINRDLLGPIFYRYLFKLHLILSSYDPNETVALFLSRGGVRIRHFYELFLDANSVKCPVHFSDFYVSRMSVIKSSLLINYETVYQDFLKEFAWYHVGDAVKAFFGESVHSTWNEKSGSENKEQPLTQAEANHLFWSDTASAEYIRYILHNQYNLYKQYLDSVAKNKKNVLLVDTGWSGSILNYMDLLDEDREYMALFFGRYNYGKSDLPWFNKIMGVEIEGVWHDKNRPETSLFINRHLIEGLCEIRCKSVEGYVRYEKDGILPAGGKAEEDKIAPIENEPQAFGVAKYIKNAENGLDIEKIHRSALNASKRIEWRMIYPTKKDTIAFSVQTRSADFGKDLDVPVFRPKEKGLWNFREKIRNVNESLWPNGQICREFSFARIPIQFIYARPERERKLQKIARYFQRLSRAPVGRKNY